MEYKRSAPTPLRTLHPAPPDSEASDEGRGTMNELITLERTKRLALMLNVGLLSIHVILFLLFYLCNVTFLVCVNVLSILACLYSLLRVWQDDLRSFVQVTYLGEALHAALAMYVLGLGPGFQLGLVTMLIMLFYAEYVGRCLELDYVFADPLALLGLGLYLAGVVFSWLRRPFYTLPRGVELGLQIYWGITVFLCAITFLRLFVHNAFRSEAKLSDQVTHDKLTGLPNRYYMSAVLDRILEREYLPGYWAAMADIDNFKHVNDTYGHNCGDYVLRTVARLIREGAEQAELCRWGGEEFLMVGRVEGDMHPQIAKLERIRLKVMEHPFQFEGQKLRVTLTIGVARCGEDMSVSEWINQADQKLYQGKCSGKNKVVS